MNNFVVVEFKNRKILSRLHSRTENLSAADMLNKAVIVTVVGNKNIAVVASSFKYDFVLLLYPYRVRVFENRVLRRIFGQKRDESFGITLFKVQLFSEVGVRRFTRNYDNSIEEYKA
jgi:hypothetical protein